MMLSCEGKLVRMPAEEDGRTHALLVFVVIGWGCFPFRHMLHSTLTELSPIALFGMCCLGKKPRRPFDWTCPRFGATGVDLGRMLWERWLQRSRDQGAAQIGIIFDPVSRQLLTLSQLHADVRGALAQFGMTANPKDVKFAASYSFRRFQPTVADVRGAEHTERMALGDWRERPRVQLPQSSCMPARYAGEIAASAVFVKVLQVRAVAAAARMGDDVLTWPNLRARLSKFGSQRWEELRAAVCDDLEDSHAAHTLPERLRPGGPFGRPQFQHR